MESRSLPEGPQGLAWGQVGSGEHQPLLAGSSLGQGPGGDLPSLSWTEGQSSRLHCGSWGGLGDAPPKDARP